MINKKLYITLCLLFVLSLLVSSCEQSSEKSNNNNPTQSFDMLTPQLKEEFTLNVGQGAIIESEFMGIVLSSYSETEILFNLIYNGNQRTLSFANGQNTVETEGYLFTILDSDEKKVTLSVNKLTGRIKDNIA